MPSASPGTIFPVIGCTAGGVAGVLLVGVEFIGHARAPPNHDATHGLTQQGLRIYKEESHDPQSSSPPHSRVQPQGWATTLTA